VHKERAEPRIKMGSWWFTMVGTERKRALEFLRSELIAQTSVRVSRGRRETRDSGRLLAGCWLVDWPGAVPGSWDAIVGFDHEALAAISTTICPGNACGWPGLGDGVDFSVHSVLPMPNLARGSKRPCLKTGGSSCTSTIQARCHQTFPR
jgi:hypothetical protein